MSFAMSHLNALIRRGTYISISIWWEGFFSSGRSGPKLVFGAGMKWGEGSCGLTSQSYQRGGRLSLS
jgi:hypothetical protein